jgi:hypothetical protein
MRNEFHLQIDLGNEAFDSPDKRRTETARIVREIAGKVADGATGGVAFDFNGNKVGKWHLDPVAEDPGVDFGFVESSNIAPTAMRRSIHRSHRGEGRNFVD